MSHIHSAACSCSEEQKSFDAANSENLYSVIDKDRIWCLNEAVHGSSHHIIRPLDDRLDEKHVLSSVDDDPELLIWIPFTSIVKIKSFALRATGRTCPSKIRFFVNREDIDLSSASDLTPAQEFDISQDDTGLVYYPTKVNRFQNISSICLHIPSSVGEEQTVIKYLAFKGEVTSAKIDKAVNVVYEARALPQDHKSKNEQQMGRQIQ